jgi:hypothetical protein
LSEGDSANNHPENTRAGFGAASAPALRGVTNSSTKAAVCGRSHGGFASHARATPSSIPKRKRSPGFTVTVTWLDSRLSRMASVMSVATGAAAFPVACAGALAGAGAGAGAAGGAGAAWA